MKVIVTGGAGYIGTHVSLALHNDGHQPVIIDDFSNSSPVSLERLETLTSCKIEWFEADVCKIQGLLDIFDSVRPDAVIHCAGLKAVGESCEKPLHYYETNILGALNVLKAMDQTATKHIIFSSSATVYGAPVYLPFDESHPLSPENPYGRTKLVIENLIRDWANLNDGRSSILLRYFNPTGANASGLLGEDPNDTPNNLMPIMLDVASGQRQLLEIYGGDYETLDGTGVRDYVHVDDLAHGHCLALSYCVQNVGLDCFNLGTGLGYSVLEVVAGIERASNKKVNFNLVGRRSGDIAKSFASNKRAAEYLKWSPKHDLDQMCIDAWNWRVKNPNGYKD